MPQNGLWKEFLRLEWLQLKRSQSSDARLFYQFTQIAKMLFLSIGVLANLYLFEEFTLNMLGISNITFLSRYGLSVLLIFFAISAYGKHNPLTPIEAYRYMIISRGYLIKVLLVKRYLKQLLIAIAVPGILVLMSKSHNEPKIGLIFTFLLWATGFLAMQNFAAWIKWQKNAMIQYTALALGGGVPLLAYFGYIPLRTASEWLTAYAPIGIIIFSVVTIGFHILNYRLLFSYFYEDYQVREIIKQSPARQQLWQKAQKNIYFFYGLLAVYHFQATNRLRSLPLFILFIAALFVLTFSNVLDIILDPIMDTLFGTTSTKDTLEHKEPIGFMITIILLFALAVSFLPTHSRFFDGLQTLNFDWGKYLTMRYYFLSLLVLSPALLAAPMIYFISDWQHTAQMLAICLIAMSFQPLIGLFSTLFILEPIALQIREKNSKEKVQFHWAYFVFYIIGVILPIIGFRFFYSYLTHLGEPIELSLVGYSFIFALLMWLIAPFVMHFTAWAMKWKKYQRLENFRQYEQE
ncbi:MAG: hypothetical protein JJT94_07990 [Bernardetiaceae bacterium]|nr:hypothetical protein [Bernardetiaceae bacterium]